MAIDAQLNEELKSLLSSGQYADASTRLKQALESQPDDADLLTLLASCELEQGDRPGAYALLEQAAETDSQHAGCRFHLGRLMISDDRIEEAGDHLTQCLILDPNHAGSRTLLARLKAARGDLDDAMSGARTALRADPDHVPALVLVAELELEKGEYDSADEHAARAVRRAPTNPAAQMVMARVMEAKGHLDFARQSLENAIKAAPQSIAPMVALAEFHDRQGQAELAVEPLRQALAIDSSRQELRLALARSLRRGGKLDEALAEYQWLLDDGTPPPALIVEGAECLAQAGRGLEARSQLNRESLADRDDVRFLLARLDLADGEREAARGALESLKSSTSPSIAEAARMLLSQLALEGGDHHSALAALDLKASKGPVEPERLWQAAGIANQAGLTNEEMRWLSALLEHNDTPEALRLRARPRLADLADRAGDYDRAAQLLRGAGWRKPLGLAEDARQIVQMALDAPNQGRAPEPADDDRRAPMIILGWPGSGRETLLAVMGLAEGCQLLDQNDWPRRRDILLQGLEKFDEGAPDAAAQQLLRRHYLRGLAAEGGTSTLAVETGVLFAPELIALKRAFPEATLVRIRADVDDLGLYWQLAGFSDVDTMKAACDEDQQQIDRLLKAWGESVIEVDMADCVPPKPEVLERLAAAFDLSVSEEAVSAGAAVVEATGLRPAGHARHYKTD